jgi:ferredoxin
MIDQQAQLRAKAGELLRRGAVEVILGFGPSPVGGVRPVFARHPDDANRLVWNNRCLPNLATYLTKEPFRGIMTKGGRVGVIAKGCDARSILVLIQEAQLERQAVHVIGMVCRGMVGDKGEVLAKCGSCRWLLPPVYDDLIGEPRDIVPIPGDPLKAARDLEGASAAERWRFWTGHLARCIKCYACRQACPLCYCEECVTERSQPQWIEKAATLRGNLAYHFIRAMHLAGRCVACDECTRACPMDIPVSMLSTYLSAKVEEDFAYTPGIDVEQEPFFATFGEDDPADHIR